MIIGAKSDIAKSLARKYADHGYDLYLAARNSSEMKDFASDIHIRSKKKVKCIELDILNRPSHQKFYDDLEEKPLGVITAVGYLGDQLKAQNEIGEAEKIIHTNFTGLVSILNIIAGDFEKRKSGFIIGISSVAGDRGRKSNYLYGASKAAFTTYLSGLRNRLFGSNITVLTVKPGYVATKMTQGMDLPKILTAQSDEAAEDILKAQLKGKDIIYTKWMWKWIAMIIRKIPERIFKGMSL